VGYIDIKEQREAVAYDADEEAKRRKRQRLRSVAIALGLGFLVILFYAATIVRMGGHGAGQNGEFSPQSQGGQSTGGAPANGGAP
jgi:hypothetical protein